MQYKRAKLGKFASPSIPGFPLETVVVFIIYRRWTHSLRCLVAYVAELPSDARDAWSVPTVAHVCTWLVGKSCLL